MKTLLLSAVAAIALALALAQPALAGDPPPPPQYVCKPPSLPKNCRIWYNVAVGKWMGEMIRLGYPMQMIYGVLRAPKK